MVATTTRRTAGTTAASAGLMPAWGRSWLLLSVPIALLGFLGSLVPFFDEGIYAGETRNWSAQAAGQDVTNLLVFPVMLALALLAYRGSLRAFLVWSGLVVYSVYAYAIYCFDVHWSRLFLLDVAVFGLSVYALIAALVSVDLMRVRSGFPTGARFHSTAAALLSIAVLFGALWLSIEIPAAVRGTAPAELRDVALPTNPVHVLDLAIFLPAVAISGLLLYRRRPLGYLLAPVMLAALSAVGVGIVALMLVSAHRGLSASPVAIAMVAGLVVVQLALLVRMLRAATPTPR